MLRLSRSLSWCCLAESLIYCSPPLLLPLLSPSLPPCRLLTAPTQSAVASPRGVVRVRLRFNITRTCANQQTVRFLHPPRTTLTHPQPSLTTHGIYIPLQSHRVVWTYTNMVDLKYVSSFAPFAPLLSTSFPPFPVSTHSTRSLALHLLPFPVPTHSTRSSGYALLARFASLGDDCCGWIGPTDLTALPSRPPSRLPTTTMTPGSMVADDECGAGFACTYDGAAYGCVNVSTPKGAMACCSQGQGPSVDAHCGNSSNKIPICPAAGATGDGCVR